MTQSKRLFCFGFGFTARVLASRLRGRGWSIAATCRTEEKRDKLRGDGVAAHLFDRDRPLDDASAALDGATCILSSVPPDAAGDPVLNQHRTDIAALAGDRAPWIGYLSTTGVYGTRNGGWVDEDSDLTPTGERGRRRVAAEDRWLELWRDHALPVHLFRLAGIYGPGRNQVEQVRAGRARRVVKQGQVFSRTHVDDIATVLEASIEKPDPGRAYNVCDDEAAPPQDVVAYACDLLGIEPPPEIPFEEAEMTDMGRSFYADNKRVRNDRIKQELGVDLAYPTYREGLRALIGSA